MVDTKSDEPTKIAKDIPRTPSSNQLVPPVVDQETIQEEDL